MKYPIYVPSKGRAGKTKTIPRLHTEGLQPFVALEPLQCHAYLRAGDVTDDKIVNVQLPDRGMGYVRDCIMSHARSKGYDWFWLLDDDITSCVELRDSYKHLRSVSFTYAMTEMEALLDVAVRDNPKCDLFFSGPCYSQSMRAWDPRPFRWNRNIGTFYLCSTSPSVRYTTGFTVRDDILFQIENWNAKRYSVQFRHYGFRCAPMGGAQGGGSESFFKEGRAKDECERIADMYPGLCEVYQRNGDWRLKINWRKIDELF